MNYLDSLLERLTNATNVGYGGDVGAVIAADLQGLRIAVEKSDDGSVYATAPGTEKNSIMIACHLDEVGFIVNSIDDDNGFIRFTEYGGTDKRILIGQQVIIHGRNDIRAYIGAKPPHLQTVEEKRKVFQV